MGAQLFSHLDKLVDSVSTRNDAQLVLWIGNGATFNKRWRSFIP